MTRKRTTKKSPSKGKTTRKKSSSKSPMAVTADRHVLYQKAVQCVESEIEFVDDTYKELRGRRATRLREDFCGTALSSCEWVNQRRTNEAWSVDLDTDVLDWGREHNVGALKGSAKDRIHLLSENVMTVQTPPVDIVVAMNFSYYIFKERAMMLEYFKSVLASLDEGGLFIQDAYGGYESYRECREKRKIDKTFTYVWDQHSYNPISGEMNCYIHFHFEDGSKMNRAFSYNWRMWTLPELRELLAEAGFSRTTVYWEGTEDDTGEGDGDFVPTEVGDADPAWICYLVSEK